MSLHYSKNQYGFKCLITGETFGSEIALREAQAKHVDYMIEQGCIGVQDSGDLVTLQNTWRHFQAKQQQAAEQQAAKQAEAERQAAFNAAVEKATSERVAAALEAAASQE